ncbi:MAG: class I SAM-dependent methyltransferase [Acidimicrobiales bacterium]
MDGTAELPAASGGEAGTSSDATARYALRVWQYKQGEMVSLMIHLGDRLGLYVAMAGAGPLTAAALAVRTGLHERWVLEWLRGQGAAGLLATTDGETFELGPDASHVLADAESLWFAAGAFGGSATVPGVVDRLADAFRTGSGLSYDELGPSAAHHVERTLGPWCRLALVPRILPAMGGVLEHLNAGARVADVGCGAGVALLAMAEAFPRSHFDGFDISRHAIERARSKIGEAGLTNVDLHVAEAAELPATPPYDLVLTLDCLHDMPGPAEAITAIKRALADGGTWLIKDIRCGPRWEDNLRNPLLAMMYATSVATCMSSGLSEPGGAGLGTLGFDRRLAEMMCRQAGFTRFTVHDFDDPANLYYEVRP